MLRTFPVIVLLMFAALVVAVVDIARVEINVHQATANAEQRAMRDSAQDVKLIARCASGKTTMVFYKGVFCNGQ